MNAKRLAGAAHVLPTRHQEPQPANYKELHALLTASPLPCLHLPSSSSIPSPRAKLSVWFCNKDKDSHSILQNAAFPTDAFRADDSSGLSTQSQQASLISRQQLRFLPPLILQWKTCGQGVVLANRQSRLFLEEYLRGFLCF